MPAGAAAVVVARDGVDTDRSLATGCSELRSGFLGGGGGGTFLLRSYKKTSSDRLVNGPRANHQGIKVEQTLHENIVAVFRQLSTMCTCKTRLKR